MISKFGFQKISHGSWLSLNMNVCVSLNLICFFINLTNCFPSSLGCGIGYGYLHRIPKCQFPSSKDVQFPTAPVSLMVYKHKWYQKKWLAFKSYVRYALTNSPLWRINCVWCQAKVPFHSTHWQIVHYEEKLYGAQ